MLSDIYQTRDSAWSGSTHRSLPHPWNQGSPFALDKDALKRTENERRESGSTGVSVQDILSSPPR